MLHVPLQVIPRPLRLEVDVREVPDRHARRAVRILLERVRDLLGNHVVRTRMKIDEIEHHLETKRMGLVDERLEVRLRTVLGIDLVVV